MCDFYSSTSLSLIHGVLPLTRSKAKHPNIVKLLGDITLKDGKWIIPLEFIFGEDLETTIFKASKSKIQVLQGEGKARQVYLYGDKNILK